VAEQSGLYALSLPKNIPHAGVDRLPFVYESTGIETFFRDERDPEPRSRRMFTFHRPEALAELIDEGRGTAAGATGQGLGSDRRALTLRGRLKEMPTQFPLITTGLWGAQIEAIQNLETSLAQNRRAF